MFIADFAFLKAFLFFRHLEIASFLGKHKEDKAAYQEDAETDGRYGAKTGGDRAIFIKSRGRQSL